MVVGDLRRHGVKETGRESLPAKSVLRCALLKQHRQLSYEELAFHLEELRGFVSSLRAAAAVLDAEEVGAAQDDQRRSCRDLGGDQRWAGSSDRAFLDHV